MVLLVKLYKPRIISLSYVREDYKITIIDSRKKTA